MDKLQNLQPWQQVQGVYVHIPFCRQKMPVLRFLIRTPVLGRR